MARILERFSRDWRALSRYGVSDSAKFIWARLLSIKPRTMSLTFPKPFPKYLTESRQKYLFFRNGSVVIKTQSRNRPTTKTETHNRITHRRAVTNDAGGRDTASMADVDAALAFLAPDETGTCSPWLPKRAWTRVDDARLRPSARSSPQILKF